MWGPIFTACAADAAVQCTTTGREHASSRQTGWLLAAAYATNTAWSLAAQTDRFQDTPVPLPIATSLTALAYKRLQQSQPSRSTSIATGMLLGWTGLASTVNIAADAVRRGAPPCSRATIAAAATGLLAVGSGLATTVARTHNGRSAVATTAAWGLLTTSTDRRRPRVIRAVAAAAGLTLSGIALLRRNT